MPYVLVDNPPTQVADDWTDLTTCESVQCLDHAISLTEIGTTVVGNFTVWTNTNPDGTEATETLDCSKWTSGSSGTGLFGQTNTTSTNWTRSAVGVCGAFAHLFCFQQD